jgi:hypothetical protein
MNNPQILLLSGVFVFLSIIGYYINYVNNYIYINEQRLRKMNYNMNSNWYDCHGNGFNEFPICQKCFQGTDVAVELYEQLPNNFFGDLKVHCRINRELKVASDDVYYYKVRDENIFKLDPGPTPQTNYQEEQEQEQYIEYIPDYYTPHPENAPTPTNTIE